MRSLYLGLALLWLAIVAGCTVESLMARSEARAFGRGAIAGVCFVLAERTAPMNRTEMADCEPYLDELARLTDGEIVPGGRT